MLLIALKILLVLLPLVLLIALKILLVLLPLPLVLITMLLLALQRLLLVSLLRIAIEVSVPSLAIWIMLLLIGCRALPRPHVPCQIGNDARSIDPLFAPQIY